jgi:hypothetical protein
VAKTGNQDSAIGKTFPVRLWPASQCADALNHYGGMAKRKCLRGLGDNANCVFLTSADKGSGLLNNAILWSG